MNDPNGLLFDGKRYHLYFQHNPFGTQWGNMHWGHAVSRDLLRWEQLDEAMYPDVNGVIFSGCGFVDRKNAAGCGAGAQLFSIPLWAASRLSLKNRKPHSGWPLRGRDGACLKNRRGLCTLHRPGNTGPQGVLPCANRRLRHGAVFAGQHLWHLPFA